MTKVFLLSGAKTYDIENLLQNQKFEFKNFKGGSKEDIANEIFNYSPDVILIQTSIFDCESVLREVKVVSKAINSQIILLLDKELPMQSLNLAEAFVEMPANEDVLLSSIRSHLKIKESLDRLNENNKELSRSLYQLNVLYNTSSQFAGTLNTRKLYEIMIEAMDKTLSYDACAVLLFSTSQKPVFNLHSIHTPSQNLVDALKIRSILNYENLFGKNISLKPHKFKDVEVNQKVKQTRSNTIFGIEIISYDSLFAPIKVGDEIFGVVELFRKIPFAKEDVTCFQAIAHQVALPLRSAKLYEQISNTNKKLEKLEKLKSEFISIVSHELKTPLTAVKNSIEIVSGQTGNLAPEIENFVQMAKRNILSLERITKDLLDLSVIQAGKLDFKYKKADITPSLELLKSRFAQVAQDKDIKLNLEITDNLPEIYADTMRIEQIFSNLISNSLKFTSNGGYVNVKASLMDASEIDIENLVMPQIVPYGKYIKVCVEDNGIGIKKEYIPVIFDKFSQIETSLNRNKGGVGLGLTITKQLIDAHLGAIWVDSVEKQGSKFNVILPVYDDKKAFKMDLLRTLTLNNKVGVVKIVSSNIKEVVNSLKEMKLINQQRELLFDDSYYFFVSDISTDSFGAYFKTLKENCSKLECNYDIMLSKAHSLTDGENIYNIVSDL